jgi:hypothetical protein
MTIISLNKGTTVLSFDRPVSEIYSNDLHKHIIYFPETEQLATADLHCSATAPLSNEYVQLLIRLYRIERSIEELVNKPIEANNFSRADKLFGMSEKLEKIDPTEDLNRFLRSFQWHKERYADQRWVLPVTSTAHCPVDTNWIEPKSLIQASGGMKTGLEVVNVENAQHMSVFNNIKVLSQPISNTQDWLKMLKTNTSEYQTGWGDKYQSFQISRLMNRLF